MVKFGLAEFNENDSSIERIHVEVLTRFCILENCDVLLILRSSLMSIESLISHSTPELFERRYQKAGFIIHF